MKNVFKPLIFFGMVFLICHCSQYDSHYHLTQKDAEKRASLLSDIHYDLHIKLTKESYFEGKLSLNFQSWKSDTIRLDYFEGDIQSIIVNGKDVSKDIKLEKGYLLIDGNYIQKGKNDLSLAFKTPYARTGNGLHTFTDPEDQEMYLYSQFEAFHANKMFPCFDQPDLKATFSLTVDAPNSWKVISTTLPISILPNPDDSSQTRHTFSKSKKISPYVFSLHAGPYTVWEDKYEQIPLRLFIRKSLARYVDPKLWFQYTKDGFGFFPTYFDFPYPFEKYDQVIVPEFNFGAMENVAAVTFSERFVSRSPMTRSQKENLSDVILHEMAHMWFGNLVTMKWWNGLWLNESFATYMASLAQEKNSEFKETWESFFEKMKQWAYLEDSFSTNHPIEAKVKDTEEAFIQFDGITYGKGASVLKQLVFFLGPEVFQKGVQSYLKRYAYSNSSLLDFLTELELAGGLSLRKWSKDWLETKGTNAIKFDYSCKDQFLSWSITQFAEGEQNRYRDHKIQIGLYKINESQTSTKLDFQSLALVYTGRNTSFVEKVSFCPDFVLLNDEDHDFVIWRWKGTQIEALQKILLNDTDSFRRLILWSNYWDQVKYGLVSFDEFYQLARAVLPHEKNVKIKKWLLSNLSSDRSYSYFTSRFWKETSVSEKDLKELSNFLWDGLKEEVASSDEQRYWFLSYLDSVYGKEEAIQIWNVLLGNITIPGLKLDQDLRWSILIKLSSLGFNDPNFESILEKERKLDTSSRGKNSYYSVLAAKPDLSSKEKWFHLVLKQKSEEYSTSTLRVIAYHLFPIYQKDIQMQFTKPFLDTLANFGPEDDENYLDGISKALAPDFCNLESKTILSKFVQSHPKLPASIKKTLKKQIDLEERCIRMRKLAK
ncbi:aminopeptidase N [Leptospira ryugenii]|uniref:Aminopeptidase N n=1 Tax=Leptospira ryugenii TaxID=1917863 RepID=A0A2P2E3E9_9LEPT|nr:aminopeptidase N [Leptospira ryugenii]GBF51391.1 aminopeptidase N [Leptospira ryugenii]